MLIPIVSHLLRPSTHCMEYTGVSPCPPNRTVFGMGEDAGTADIIGKQKDLIMGGIFFRAGQLKGERWRLLSNHLWLRNRFIDSNKHFDIRMGCPGTCPMGLFPLQIKGWIFQLMPTYHQAPKCRVSSQPTLLPSSPTWFNGKIKAFSKPGWF